MARRKREQSNEETARKKRIAEVQLVGMGEIFPGFDEWYRENYDENGRYVGHKLPGLKPPMQTEGDEHGE